MPTNYDVMQLAHDSAWRDREFARLRREEPLVFDEERNWWLVLRHADVREVGTREDVFSSQLKGAWHLFDADYRNIQTLDGREHTLYRNTVSRAFTPRMASQLGETAREAIDRAIDRVLDSGEDEFDFVSALAVPVPLCVIGAMVGIEPGDYDQFRRWSDDAFASAEPGADPAERERIDESTAALQSYVREAITKRRAQPRDDVLSEIIRADADGILAGGTGSDRVRGDDAVHDFANTLMLAGNETTRHAISSSFYALDQNPEQRAALIRNPALWRTGVDELLRWSTPVRTLRRTASRDTELGAEGTRIRAGESLLMMYQSANRDEAVFDEPFELRLDREDAKEQLAFGMGPHYCIGANLAKMELRIALERIYERLPGLRVAEGAVPEPNRSSIIDGVDRLPVVLER